MKLITKELEKKIPALGKTAKEKDPMVQAKLFMPWGHWTWYIIEMDENKDICFGLVDGFEEELGSFSIEELMSVTGPFGLKIERDIHFQPKRLSEVKRR